VRFNDRHGGRRAGAGRRYLVPGEPTIKIAVRVPLSLKAKVTVRRRELGLTESEYVRRILINATLRVPTDEG
jgi:hypothetical protein